ncbi:MAG: YegJ family protein [Hyphomonadaceae bacterium]
MRHVLIAVALSFALTSPAVAQKQDNPPVVEDQVMGYHDSDERMNRAIEQARALLPLFVEEFRSANTQARGAFTVKAGLTTSDGGREHIWVADLSLEGDRFIGNLINEPYDLPGLSLGSRVEVPLDIISDWTIATPDGVYGGFTTRVMIDDMPPDQAQRYREGLQMTASPTPPGWIQ